MWSHDFEMICIAVGGYTLQHRELSGKIPESLGSWKPEIYPNSVDSHPGSPQTSY